MKRLQRSALMLLFSLLLFVISSGPFSVKASAAGNSVFTDYGTWVKDPNADTSWKSGTSSTNGNVKISLDINVTNETVNFYSAGGSIGYNAGQFVPNILCSAGDVISFTVTSPIKSYFIGYGSKIEFSSSGLRNYTTDYVTDTGKAKSYGTLKEFTGTENISFTLEEDGYFYFYAYVGKDTSGRKLDVTFSNVKISSVNGTVTDVNFLIEGINNIISDVNDKITENFGAVGFAHDTVENFIGLFNEEPPAPIINVPPLKMKIKGVEHQFFNGYQYDFRSMEENGLSVLVGAVRTAGTLVLWWAFLQYCFKEFDGFFRR